MNNWIVKAMKQDGQWLQWSKCETQPFGYWSNHQPPALFKKEDASAMAKRVFNEIGWVYGVKIEENL